MNTAARTLWVFGLSSRTAPVAVREALAFDPAAALALLRRVAVEQPGTEALVLSTCHRTEFYVVPPAGQGPGRFLEMVVNAGRCPMSDGAGQPHPVTWCRTSSGHHAFVHLARVACGLDSPILGDSQILGQLRRATTVACEAGSFGRYLSQATAAALRVGRQARHRTAISQGTPGIGSAVVTALAERGGDGRSVFGPVLVLGAGEAAQAIGHALRRAGQQPLWFANRTFERARALAGQCGGQARAWEDLPALLAEASVVVAATAAPLPVIGPWSLPSPGPALVIDAGFPRQVSAQARVEVVALGTLEAPADAALAARQAAVPSVEAMIGPEVTAWRRWLASLPVEERIKDLWLQADALCSESAADRRMRVAVRRELHIQTQSLRALQEVNQ